MEKAPTRAFSWLKAPTSAFTFKTLLRHYAKRALTPRSLNVKLGPRHNYHKGRVAKRHYANQTLVGAFSVIVQPVVEPMEHYTALITTFLLLQVLSVQHHHHRPERADNAFTGQGSPSSS